MKYHYMKSPEGHIYQTQSPDTWKDCERLPQAKGKEAYAEQAKARLREVLQPGQTVYCVLRHVSASGMSREISVLAVVHGEICNLDHRVATALGWSEGKKGIKVGGCGMDMGFHLVYTLSRTLWHDENKDSGYFLKKEWI